MGRGAAAVRPRAGDGGAADAVPEADGSVGRGAGAEGAGEPATTGARTLMPNSSLDAIVPMLCVTLAALAVMGAEAFRGRDENMPLGGLGIVGFMGAAISSGLLWNRNSASFGVIVADNFGLFVTLVLVIVGILPIMFSSPVIRRDGLPKGEY